MRVPVVAGRSLRLMQVGKWVTITAVDDFLGKQATNMGAPACSMPGKTLVGLAFGPAIMTMP